MLVRWRDLLELLPSEWSVAMKNARKHRPRREQRRAPAASPASIPFTAIGAKKLADVIAQLPQQRVHLVEPAVDSVEAVDHGIQPDAADLGRRRTRQHALQVTRRPLQTG